MSEPSDIAGELDPRERELAQRLTSQRPVPAAEFRGTLGRHLATHDPGYGPRREHLRALVAMALGAGGALMAVGALDALGIV
jgi:hypothetical protein